MPRAVAVNVAANTNEPGFRGPVYPDGAFAYVPIPEAAATGTDASGSMRSRDAFPVDEPLPTYADLELPFSVPAELRGTPVHMDPEFPGVHGRNHASYGDPYGVKAGPIADLAPGDWLLFYATLTLRPADWRGPGDDRAGDWLRDRGVAVADGLAPDWGAYLFAGMRVDRVAEDPDREAATRLAPTNAHLKREPFDARVIVRGDPAASGPFDRVVPLSSPESGADASPLVTERSSDSGKGPWWRRPMRFDSDATAELLARIADAGGPVPIDT